MTNSSKLVILVNGLTRSGKDTFADYIVKHYNFTKKSFAGNIKYILAKTFDISLEELDYLKNKETLYYYKSHKTNITKSITFRKLFQRFGTEGMQTLFGKDVWVLRVLKEIQESRSNMIVISDLRFKTEYDTLSVDNLNLVTVHVNNPRSISYNHKSDNELKDFKFDYKIENNGSLEEYYKKCREIIEDILRTKNIKN